MKGIKLVDILNNFHSLNSQLLFKIVSENATDLIAILNDEYKFEYINSKAHKILTAYSEEDLIGHIATDLIHPKDQKKTFNSLKKVYTVGEMEGETRIKCKDGSYIWVTMKAMRYFEKDGKIKVLLIAKEIHRSKAGITRKSEDRFKEMIDNLTEIRFWKFLQPKQAIAAYQESQEMLRLVMDSIPQYIAWKDKELIYLGCNTNFLKLMGLNEEKDLIGKTDFDLGWGEEFAYSSRVNDMRVIENGNAEYHIIESWNYNINKNIWFDINRIPLHDSKGNVVGILLTYEDITDRKLAEENLKESEQKFRDLTEVLPDVIFEADLSSNITYTNPMGYELFGYTPEDLEKGLSFLTFIPDSREREQVIKRVKEILQGTKPKAHEYLMQKKDGSQFYGRIHSIPKFKDDRVVGLRGILHDITESKLAEQKLKESEAKYRHLFNNTPYAVWLVNLKGDIIDCNITMNKFLSILTKDDIIGKNFRDVMKLFIMKGDSRFKDLEPIFHERFKQVLAGNELEPLEFKVNRGDGKEFWISLESSFVEGGDESLLQVFIKDITERKQADLKIQESEEELLRLNKELEQKVRERTKELEEKNIELQKLDKIKDEFITHAAHELKTPLISIAGYTDYILYKYENLELEIKNDLQIVQRNIARLHKLMNQLLEVMKIESQKMELNKEVVNMSSIVENCLKELSYLIKEKHHETLLDMSGKINLLVDPDRIFQVFSNIISNAIKFTPENGRIEISAKKENADNFYVFKVKDNGIGLNEVEIEKLFKKFEMVKQISDESYKKGTGLGLYISKGFIEAHGGKIWATSDGPDKGTTISFSLPV